MIDSARSLTDQQMIKLTEDIYIDFNSVIGHGAFGKVYIGYNDKLSSKIAIKQITYISRMNPCDKIDRQHIILHDLAILKHPNILQYYGHAFRDNLLYIFTEYCSGGNLNKFIQNKMKQWQILTFFKQLISGVKAFHAQNILHRDLKPDNILITEQGKLKVADFGVSRTVQLKMTPWTGTPFYMAPEINHINSKYSQKCDVWSLGVILYEMVGGQWAHTEKQLNILLNKFKNPDYKLKIPSGFHYQWQNILNIILIHDPQKRPTCQEVQRQFLRVEQQILSSLSTDQQSKYKENIQGKMKQNELIITQSDLDFDQSQSMVEFDEGQNWKINDKKQFFNENYKIYEGTNLLYTTNKFAVKVIRIRSHIQGFLSDRPYALLHPNLTKIHFYTISNQQKSLICFCDYFIEGHSRSLFDVCKNKTDMSLIINIFRQLINVMVYLQKQNKVCLNLTPQAIFLTDKNQIKINVYHIKNINSPRRQPIPVTGPIYCAPQIINQQNIISNLSDVWSIGFILWQMLIRKYPFEQTQYIWNLKLEIQMFASKKNKEFEGVPEVWKRILNAMLTWKYNERSSFQQIYNICVDSIPGYAQN